MRTPAYATTGASEALGPFTLERREPGAEEVLIDILYCGVCHSDLHQVRNEWGGSRYPMVPGHEIIGRVSRVGAEVDRWQVGDLVGVGCFVDSCRRCPSCEEGEEQYCDVGMTETYNGLERDGVTPTQGGYSKRITV
ncbi:MAG: alcohol dehydrogenase catalytic domain-containing protein, partial [Myxococcales bacterium]|nr:alcohol dehydrogenase catalytic domain-containing protein [Myxococcales bacterium]